jgi:hypothetical protein
MNQMDQKIKTKFFSNLKNYVETTNYKSNAVLNNVLNSIELENVLVLIKKKSILKNISIIDLKIKNKILTVWTTTKFQRDINKQIMDKNLLIMIKLILMNG